MFGVTEISPRSTLWPQRCRHSTYLLGTMTAFDRSGRSPRSNRRSSTPRCHDLRLLDIHCCLTGLAGEPSQHLELALSINGLLKLPSLGGYIIPCLVAVWHDGSPPQGHQTVPASIERHPSSSKSSSCKSLISINQCIMPAKLPAAAMDGGGGSCGNLSVIR